MKRVFFHKVVVAVCLIGVSAQAESLNFAQSVTYATPSYGGDAISQGLYVRGCGIYTSNDKPTPSAYGIPNSVLRHSSAWAFSAEPGSIVSVGVEGVNDSSLPWGYYQRVLVEDWFGTGSSAISSYQFTGVGSGTENNMRTFRMRDYDACTVFSLTDVTQISGEWESLYTTYKDTVYVSGYSGLQVLTFNPTTGATSFVTSSPGRHVLGAWRLGNRIYEAAGYDLGDDGSDSTAEIFIRNAATLGSVQSLQITGIPRVGSADGGGGFKVVKDSFIVNGQKQVRTIGALASINHLILMDLSNDSIDTLYCSRSDTSFPFIDRLISDIAVLDRRLFALTSPLNEPNVSFDYRIDVWDISNPAEPEILVSRSTELATSSGDDGMDTVSARKDSLGSPILNTLFHLDARNRLQVVRNRYTPSINPTGFWDTDGSYSIFANMRATSDPGNSQGGYPFVHQILYTPSNLDTFRIGNVNGSSGANINIADVTTLMAYLNDTTNTVAVHRPLSRYDVNCDGYVNWADHRALWWYMFQSGQKPGRICANCF